MGYTDQFGHLQVRSHGAIHKQSRKKNILHLCLVGYVTVKSGSQVGGRLKQRGRSRVGEEAGVDGDSLLVTGEEGTHSR